jgi:Ca-activated chloride channel homolog
MRFSAYLILIFLVTAVCAQSGRVKPNEKEKPEKIPGILTTVESGVRIADSTQKMQKNPSPMTSAEDEIIKISSMLVTIPVSVTDKNSKPVLNLSAEDFILEINGKPAQIGDVFFAERIPIKLALLLDRSFSVSSAWNFEKKAAVKFLRQVLRSEEDMVALFSISSVPKLEQPLTEKISVVARAVESLREPKGATALFDAVVMASEYLKNADNQEDFGRRVIVIISDGDDNLSDATLEDAIRSVQINNCLVYVVKTSDFENFRRTGNRSGNANTTFLIADKRVQQLALQTGGAVYSPIDEAEMDKFFSQIANEISQQYILSYYAEGENSVAGRSYQITVKVKNHPDLIVRARKSYFIPKD